ITPIKLTPSQELEKIPDYLIWSIGNFILFFILGIVCVILSVRVREHKAERDYFKTADRNNKHKPMEDNNLFI
ncbi:unnamed protein product, partial [Didymodactylos carnosus]